MDRQLQEDHHAGKVEVSGKVSSAMAGACVSSMTPFTDSWQGRHQRRPRHEVDWEGRQEGSCETPGATIGGNLRMIGSRAARRGKQQGSGMAGEGFSISGPPANEVDIRLQGERTFRRKL